MSRIHDDLFWIGDVLVRITSDSIHKMTSLSRIGVVLLVGKDVRKLVELTCKSRSDRRGMTIEPIEQEDIKLMSMILGYKFHHTNKVNSVSVGTILAAIRLVKEDGEFNLCEILCTQLIDNIKAIKHDKTNIFRFGSLIIYMYLHIVGRVSDLYLDKSIPTMPQISNKASKKSTLRDYMTLELKTFRVKMQMRYRIPESIVEKYKHTICFMVETDTTCMEAVEPRNKWIHPLGYEVEEQVLEAYVQVLLSSPKDPNEPRWGTYEEKTREVDAKLKSTATKRKVAKVTSKILRIHGVSQADLDKARDEKIALELKSANASKVESHDPKMKKIKIEKDDS